MWTVSCDIETTGLDPSWCQILEIGAVIDNLEDQLPIEKLPKFHCYVVHDKIIGEPYALSMHAEVLKRIAKRDPGYFYYDISEVAEIFYQWLSKHYPGCEVGSIINRSQEIGKVNFAGKNFASFDLQFLEKVPHWDAWVKYHRRVLDPTIWHLKKGDISMPDTKECLMRAGIKREISHTALQDSMDVVELLRNGWNKFVSSQYDF
jgi:oligoribonuclease (3'-5' exoribonuclease)